MDGPAGSSSVLVLVGRLPRRGTRRRPRDIYTDCRLPRIEPEFDDEDDDEDDPYREQIPDTGAGSA